jgi:tRNA A-37 threonylcarbamoyl transferase component Bud32
MVSAALLQSGDVIGGFRIDDVIGIGGMAIVYRAEQVSLGRRVALKVLSSKLTNDVVFRERFRREGTHAAALEHPNIVPVYDSGEQDGNLYIAMRLVEGTNLAELIQTRGVTADRTIELLRPIASALDTAHATGLIHRDVKPQNILITSEGHPYLADFGVAKGSNTYGLTATGGFVGSVNYASPEQIKGLTLTPASDVYALTAVLYQCLSGHVPFPRETDAGVMHAHLHDPPPSLPTLTGADSDFHTVLARGMAKDPGARYGHAGDLMNAAALSVSRLPVERRNSIPAFPGAEDPSQPDELAPAAPGAAGTEILASEDLASVRVGAGLTEADRRRGDPPPAVLDEPRRARPPLLVAGAVAVLVAIIAVAVLAITGARGAHASTFYAGELAITASPGWHRVPTSVRGLTLESPVAIGEQGISVAAGGVTRPSAIPASVPPALMAIYGSPARTVLVNLPLGQARMYTWPLGSHPALSLLMIVTERSESVIACSTVSAARVPAMEAACAALRRGAKIVGSGVAYPGPDPAVAASLSVAVHARAGALATAASSLNSPRLIARATPLRALATAEQHAAYAVARIAAPPRDHAAIGGLAGALAREATVVRGLAGAAQRRDGSLYDAIRARLSPSAVPRAASALATIGFDGLDAAPIAIGRAPVAQHRHRPASSPVSSTASTPAGAPVQPAAAPPVQVQPAHTPLVHRQREEIIITKPQ